ncbi:hypothetical protein ACQ4PT_060023 [Festuca glaucescens]
MAHLLRSILYPSEGHPHHLTTPPKVTSFSASNHGRPRLSEGAPASNGEGGPVLQGFRARYSNPEVIFDQDPEIEEPAASRFVADSILGGFDLNQQLHEDNCDVDAAVNGNAAFVPGQEVLLLCRDQKVLRLFRGQKVLQVGMLLKKQLMRYLRNLLFLMLACTAHNVPKDTILNRVFECVHTGKTATATKGARNRKDDAANVLDSTVDMSSFTSEKQAKDKGMQMDMSDTRQRNRLLRYDCKAHMHIGKRNGSWTVTVFIEEHAHPMIMGCLGNVRDGDLRTLGYVKRDVSNIRTMLRNDVSLRDMSLTIEYFEKKKAESPSFFYATQLDENNAVRALF